MEEEDTHEQDGEDEDPQYMSGRSLALVIDSLDMLAHRLGGMPATMDALRPLLKIRRRTDTQIQTPFFGPILTVLHQSASSSLISPTWHKALEDLATTNIYIQPHDETRGRCFTLRRSASGKVQEEWEGYELQLLERGSSGGGGGGAARRTRKRRSQNVKVVFTSSTSASSSGVDKKAEERNGSSGLTAAPGGGRKEKKEAAFLESLPFRLSLNEQEKAMRGQTVLPHERQQTGQQPLIYHEDEGGDYDEEGEEEEEEEEDESDEDSDIDDDLDI
jgi:hypothetical protein